MKIQIIAEIEGDFLLNKTVSAKLYPYEFDIFEKNNKRYISITKPIIDYKDVAPKLYVKNGITNIVATKPEAYKDMEQWLSYIEAMGSFNFDVDRIHTDELEVKWICETEEEKGCIPIVSLKRNRGGKTPDKYLSNSNLSNLVIFQKMLPEAHIPFSYYRQAKIFFNENNYYFAYINYFMMLEFMFSDGKFHKKDITENFKKSDLLKLSILRAIEILRTQGKDEFNYFWISNECENKKKNFDFDGIVYLFIEYRGLLSHASIRSKKYLLDDNQLRPITLFISIVCHFLCGYIQIYCCSSGMSKKRMIQDSISELLKKI